MKLCGDFLRHESSGETFLVPSGSAKFSGIIRGNKTLNLILTLLEHDTTQDEIIKTLRSEYSAPEGIIERDVQKVIDNLRETGALIE